jgi:hypothetical protein
MIPSVNSPRMHEYVVLRNQAASIWSRVDEMTALILCGDYDTQEWLTVAALEAQATILEEDAKNIYNSPDFWAGWEQAGEGLKIHEDLGELYND